MAHISQPSLVSLLLLLAACAGIWLTVDLAEVLRLDSCEVLDSG